MNALQPLIRFTTRNPRIHLILPLTGLAVALSTALTLSDARGQDRIRIVESPRTAMRESRPTQPQASPLSGTTPNAVAAGQSSNGYEERFVTEMQDH